MAEANSKDRKMDNPIQPVTSAVEGETLKTTDDRALDEAAKYLAHTEGYGPMTPEKEKQIVKKIDAWMIPMVRADTSSEDRAPELT